MDKLQIFGKGKTGGAIGKNELSKPIKIRIKKEQVNHPKHYNLYPIETIEMMIKIWGTKKVIDFCYMNAFKYRMRLGMKNTIKQDLKKEKWYLKKAKELEAFSKNKVDKCIFDTSLDKIKSKGIISPKDNLEVIGT